MAVTKNRKASPRKRKQKASGDVIHVTGTPEQRDLNKPLLAKYEQQLKEIAAMSDAERVAAERDYKKFVSTFRKYAMSYRNRSRD